MTDYKAEAEEHYGDLDTYRKTTEVFVEELKLIDDYVKMFCWIIRILGDVVPRDVTDRCVRDLAADAFDGLQLAKDALLAGTPSMSFAALRRTYETNSLIAYLILKPGAADQWAAGKKVEHEKIRKFLGKHPLGSPEEELRDRYKFLATAAHLNRSMVPVRHLGDGNQFTLGSIGRPLMSVTGEFFIELISDWFWLTALLLHRTHQEVARLDEQCMREYVALGNRVHPFLQKLHAEVMAVRLKEREEFMEEVKR
jgi:hypothetical protein